MYVLTRCSANASQGGAELYEIIFIKNKNN